MNRKTCTNKSQCCDEGRCRCDENETVVLEHEEMEMMAQMLREQIRTLSLHPRRFSRFGSVKSVKEKLSAILIKMQ